MTRKIGRPKSCKRKVNVNLSIDEDLYREARRDIDNISAYVTQCLKRHLSYVNDLENNYINNDDFIQDWTSTSHNRQNVDHKKSTLSITTLSRQSAMLNDYTHDTWSEEECQEISDEEFDKILESL